MEPIAVSHTTITQALFQEGFALVFDRKKQKTLLLCGILFAVFGLFFLLVQYCLKRVIVLGGPVLLMGLFVIGWSCYLPHSECRKKYHALCRKNKGSPIERTISFYETGFVVSSPEQTLAEINWSEVLRYEETEHLIVLICENHAGVMIGKDTLSESDRKRLFAAPFTEQGKRQLHPRKVR